MQLALLAACLVCGSSGPVAHSGAEDSVEFIDSSVVAPAPGAAALYAASVSATGADALDASGVDLSGGDASAASPADESASVATTSTPLLNGGGVVAAGRRFSFFVRPGEGEVYAMGENTHGQLGVDSMEDVFIPRPVLLNQPAYPESVWVVAIAASAVHALFLTQDGDVYATGWNRFGQFGTGGTSSDKSMVGTRVHTGVTSIATGYGHSLFLMQDQAVQGCGLNSMGQLGDGTRTNRRTPIVAYAAAVIQIAAGYDFSLFLNEMGQVYGTGNNLAGQLGDDSRTIRLSPVLAALYRSEEISAGWSHVVYRRGPWVWASGANTMGQLGSSAGAGFFTRPLRISDLTWSQRTWAGGDGTCTWFESPGNDFWYLNMTLKCSGVNLDGQLGLGDAEIVLAKTEVPGAMPNQMAMGPSHSLTIMRTYSDYKVAGSNAHGELGDGTNVSTKEFKELGLAMTATTTETVTVTTVTETATSTTFTATTVFRTPSSDPDGGVDDGATTQMLQILLGLGLATLLLGFPVRFFCGLQPPATGGAVIDDGLEAVPVGRQEPGSRHVDPGSADESWLPRNVPREPG